MTIDWQRQPETQSELVERFIRSFGPKWGHEAKEQVPVRGKYETGRFRCARCVEHDIPVKEIEATAGASFPECEPCDKIGKPAQDIRTTFNEYGNGLPAPMREANSRVVRMALK